MDDLVVQENLGAVTRLTLNAPDRFNGLSQAMLATLSDRLSGLGPETRVVVLRGAGKVFCAGHDLREMQAARQAEDHGRGYFSTLFAGAAALCQQIAELPQPVIAAVHGLATAAGTQLACACDLIMAAEDARFGVNGIDIGLFCTTPAVTLSRRLPPAVAFELLVTGDFLPASRAHALGMVNRLAPADQLEAVTLELAQRMASKLPAALHLGKAAFRAQMEQPMGAAFATACAAMVENALASDTAEGFAAFLEKRKPGWA